MNPFRFLSGVRLLLGMFLGVSTAPAPAGAGAAREPGDRPNIVLIMADDVGWEAFGCYGGEDYRTPNLDRLAAEGARFTHCYATPLCTPTRVQLMTGQYNFRNYTHFGYLDPAQKTFGHLLRDAGYATAVAGKWQLNGVYNSLPGHEDALRPRRLGFDEFCLWQLTRLKDPATGGGERYWSPPLERNGEFLTIENNRGAYGPDLLGAFVCDFMERHRDRPFFVYYPMMLVHDPFVPTPETIGDASRDPSANKEPRGAEAKKANFAAMMETMDRTVGGIVARIDALGQRENTLILFTADNGTHPAIVSRWQCREVRGGKGGMTDTGTRVPLIASWKGVTPAGTVIDDLVDFTDFYPTLAEAAGSEPGAGDPIDGRSFLPRLRGEPGNPREWVLCHYQPYWNKEGGQFVRDREYKLYRDGRFFHVPSDLEEKNPLAAKDLDTAAADARARLQAVLDRCPPVVGGSPGKNTPHRPVHPGWPNLVAPAPGNPGG